MKLIVPQSTLILKHKIFSKGNIIFIHGFGSCSFNAIKLLTNLFQKGFNVYAFDLPNHGKNSDYATQLTVDEYISFSIQKIKSFNLKKFFLMGHSMGGGIVSYIGSEFPTQIKGMILLSPFNYGAAIHTKRKIASFGIKLLGPFSTLLSPWLSKKPDNSSFNPKKLFLDLFSDETINKINYQCPKYTGPLLVVVGTNDMVINPVYTKEYFDEKEKDNANYSLYTIQNCTHSTQVGEIPEITNLIVKFCKKYKK